MDVNIIILFWLSFPSRNVNKNNNDNIGKTIVFLPYFVLCTLYMFVAFILNTLYILYANGIEIVCFYRGKNCLEISRAWHI